MPGCKQLHHSRTAGKSSEEYSLSVGVVAVENILQHSYQIAVVIDWHGVGRKDASARAFHLPEGDVVFLI